MFSWCIVNFTLLDNDLPRATSHDVYTRILRWFVLLVKSVALIIETKKLIAKLLKQGYRYHKLREIFSKFYRRHFKLMSKSNICLQKPLQEGLSETNYLVTF